MNIQSLKNQLSQGLASLQLTLSDPAQDKILQYILLLDKWNKAFNLTAIRDPEEMLTRHILDSLSIAPYLFEGRTLDVGTGAGLPGIPLALTFPDRAFVLLDSNGKKTRFLVQAKAELDLKNVEIVQSRIEDYQPEQCFNNIVARAVTTLAEMETKTRHLCCQNGQICLMKGVYPTEELKAVKCMVKVYPLSVPGLHAQRHLVCLGLGKASE